jgi:hypothetical protein
MDRGRKRKTSGPPDGPYRCSDTARAARACRRANRGYTERIISTVTNMGRTLSLLARLPLLEDDGITHRRDCDCVRCDAGYRPTEHERAEARRRHGEQKAREQAARVMARRKERERMKLAVVDVFVDEQVRAANDQVRALREARDRAAADERLARLWELRRAGLSLPDALAAVERREAREHGEDRREARTDGEARADGEDRREAHADREDRRAAAGE